MRTLGAQSHPDPDINMVTVANQWPGWNHHHPQPPLTPPYSPPDHPCHDLRDLDIQFTETMPLQPRRSRRNLARCSTIDLSDIEDSEASRSPRPSFHHYSGGSVTTVSTDHTHSDAASFDAGDNHHHDHDVEFENPPSPTICLPSGKFLISHKTFK